MEHRWGERVAVIQPVRISCAGVTGVGRLKNLSISGAFIETTLPLSTMAMVRVRIPRRENGEGTAREAAGFVVRRELSGFAIEWCDLGALHPAHVQPSPAHADELYRTDAATSLTSRRAHVMAPSGALAISPGTTT